MKTAHRSKFTVIGFIIFVLLVYSGSYFYTKYNNQRLLASPRLVMLVGDANNVNVTLKNMDKNGRLDAVKNLYEAGVVISVSQLQYEKGVTDIRDYYINLYPDRKLGDQVTIDDCKDFSALMKRTMEKTSKNNLRESWIFSACGVIW
jgi:hypothetical protein